MNRCSNMPTIQANKINMNEVESELRTRILQRADPFNETMTYLRKLFEGRYDHAEWNYIEGRVRRIIFLYPEPVKVDKMKNYIEKGLLKNKIYIDDLYL